MQAWKSDKLYIEKKALAKFIRKEATILREKFLREYAGRKAWLEFSEENDEPVITAALGPVIRVSMPLEYMLAEWDDNIEDDDIARCIVATRFRDFADKLDRKEDEDAEDGDES